MQQIASSDTSRVAVVQADWTTDETLDSAVDLRPLLTDGTTLMNEAQIIERMNTLQQANDLVLVVAAPTQLVADYRFWVEHYPRVVYVYRANQVRTSVDTRLEHYLTEAGVPVVGAVLNQVDVAAMEDVIGDVPKPRNKVRIFIKKVLRRDF